MYIHSRTLFIVTFISVLLVILGVGGIGVKIALSFLTDYYNKTVQETTKLQAEAAARVLERRLETGASPEEVLSSFQAFIEGSHAAKNYLCLIDHTESRLLCHPDTNMINASLSSMPLAFAREIGKKIDFATAMYSGESQHGRLYDPYADVTEFVYSHRLKNTNWVLNSHQNIGAIEAEIASIERNVAAFALLFGVLMAFPASLVSRGVSRRYERRIEEQSKSIAKEQQLSEQLLNSIFPHQIAQQLKRGTIPSAEQYNEVTILFADLKGFTELAAHVPAVDLVTLLNAIFSKFDAAADRNKVEKIKTIGDAYMAVSGVPIANKDHRRSMLVMAFDLFAATKEVNDTVMKDIPSMRLLPSLQIRIGISSGTVVAGVLGTRKFAYDLWGDTVNMAARLESNGIVGAIHCTEDFLSALDLPVPVEIDVAYDVPFTHHWNTYEVRYVRIVKQPLLLLKGKGEVQTYTIEAVC